MEVEEARLPEVQSPDRVPARRGRHGAHTRLSRLRGRPGALQVLLEAHVREADALATRAASAELEMLEFALDRSCPNPEAALKGVGRLERIRSSAMADVRRAAGTMRETRHGRAPVQVAVVTSSTPYLDGGASAGRLLDGEAKERR